MEVYLNNNTLNTCWNIKYLRFFSLFCLNLFKSLDNFRNLFERHDDKYRIIGYSLFQIFFFQKFTRSLFR